MDVGSLRKQLVAVGSIIIERKFTRGGGIIGHIEDIAVSKSMQGRKLGLKIINTLEAIGRGQGCYKIILDCSKDNIREPVSLAVSSRQVQAYVLSILREMRVCLANASRSREES